MSFPLALQLFSPVVGRGSPADQTDASRWLLSLVSHPSTPAILAERAQQLLARLIAHRSLSSTTLPNSSPLLTAQHFVDALVRLGIKTSLVDHPGHNRMVIEGAAMDLDDTTLGRPVESGERSDSVLRTLKVVCSLASATPRSLLSSTDTTSLAVLLVRLAVDPIAGPMRAGLERTLHALLATLPAQDLTPRTEVIQDLVATFRHTTVRTKLEVVLVIPHATKASKLLRKALAWALLADSLPTFVRPCLILFISLP